VRYDKSARAVVLSLSATLPKRAVLMITAVGRPPAGITDLLGHYLDGNKDGTPGDDFETILTLGKPRRRR
jgi:hypothetical protein